MVTYTVHRIIPARAGFTNPPTLAFRDNKDHPRSRGVYLNAPTTHGQTVGSSPLARGLPLNASDGSFGFGGGIIPARAGFTRCPTAYHSPEADHPRSRGVYAPRFTHPPSPAGSSPLARGLPSLILRSSASRGIIPARAGFTPSGGGPQPVSADHPRSRGVYHHIDPLLRRRLGSSPLARGLRHKPSSVRYRNRIIPARAGFTASKGGGSQRWWDHPRSRGVYCCSELRGGVTVRIIPARAGFTGSADRGSRTLKDHPRSRGVYAVMVMSSMQQWGSSPLARGLPQHHREQQPRPGIIPARAGFTICSPVCCNC